MDLTVDRRRALFGARHRVLLRRLLETSTVTPMESGEPSALSRAQELIIDGASAFGASVALHEPPPQMILDDPQTPVAVRQRASEMGDAFLASQPNLVLRLGSCDSTARTLMFNVHLDTVGAMLPVGIVNGRVTGRGACDMKGPAIALFAGLEAVATHHPAALEQICLLVQCAGGEEGGALGVYGTRELIRRGYVGALNVFAEPTTCRYLDRCSAAMTAELRVGGHDASDDVCERATNATVLLGWLAGELPLRLDDLLRRRNVRLCVGGLHTGTTHDRAYGEGTLLLNFIYETLADARTLERAVEHELNDALARFQDSYAGIAGLQLTARSAQRCVSMRWLKRRMPALHNRSAYWEAMLDEIGIERVTENDAIVRPFTCDAIWGRAPGAHSVILGPGELGRNGAHTPQEHVGLDELERYAAIVRNLVMAFAARAWEQR